MASISNIRGSGGAGSASRATVTASRPVDNPTITVDTLANWPASFIAVTGTPDLVAKTIQPATLQIFYGHESGGTVSIDSFADGYTDLGNAVGDIVILKPTTAWVNEIADILATSLNDDGSIKISLLEEILDGDHTTNGLRFRPRLSVQASTATLTPNVDTDSYYRITAQAASLSVANHTGTPLDGEGLFLELQDNGTSRAISWGTDYVADSIYGLGLPTATVAGKTHFITFTWNEATSKYVAVM
jgi:hypothetical protein